MSLLEYFYSGSVAYMFRLSGLEIPIDDFGKALFHDKVFAPPRDRF